MNEGIITLVEGSRISDAIDMAGGLKEEANLDNINLAYKLEDGMKVYIPSNYEVSSMTEDIISSTNNDETYKYIESSTDNTNNENSEIEEGKVNINTASQTELETLSGIGPSTALKIIDYREENGDFNTIEEVQDVSGIGDSKYESIKDFICVD